jgi:hypothetical protein
MAEAKKPTRKAGSYNWLLWWVIGADELRDQVANYRTYKIYQSARGLSLLLFILSAILTTLITEFLTHVRLSYLDAALFLILGAFIYFGHRWAMIAGMVLWTFEKVFQILSGVHSGHIPNLFGIVIFWTIYMHAMFLAFRTEQARRAAPAIDEAVFD